MVGNKMKNLLVLSLYLLISSFAFAQQLEPGAFSNQISIQERIETAGELAPLPEAKPLLLELEKTLSSREVTDAIQGSATLQMLRERLRTSLFHLNLKFEVAASDYPYDPVFKEPLPFRPTLEAIGEAIQFFEIVSKTTGFRSHIVENLIEFPYFESLQHRFSKNNGSLGQNQRQPPTIEKSEIVQRPVDSYLSLQSRLKRFGETASFPEFEGAVNDLLEGLKSKEIEEYKALDEAFKLMCESASAELESVKSNFGKVSRLQNEFHAPFPYRRTIQAIERGIGIFDLKERLKYPESKNWHEVELSWYRGGQPKLLPLYHFNRYKYQMYGLLANPEMVLLPWAGDASFEDLIRLRSVPLGIIGVTKKTLRVDRHHNSPLDFLYHDVNHIRRMWGYDKRKREKKGVKTRSEVIAIYRQQEAFVNSILAATAPTTNDSAENEIRKLQRIIIFETFHETALTADSDSLLKDLRRQPNTPQPFELQVRAPIQDLEKIRTFDGNLVSGADKLPLSMSQPTTIRFFLDRAPGFLANNDNKIRWGFHDSVFKPSKKMLALEFRTPAFLAEAATRLFHVLGQNPPPMNELLGQINNRSGQPELYNYFSLEEETRDKRQETNLKTPANQTKSSGVQGRNKCADLFLKLR